MDDDDIISLLSSSDDESNSSLDESELDLQEDLDNEQWLIDIFNESIMEKYKIDEDEVDEQAKNVLNDDESLGKVHPLVRKTYLQIVLLIERMKNSALH